jgi:DNA-binding transcriptional MocR family regulator
MMVGDGTWSRSSRAAALDKRLSAAAFRVLAILGCYADATGHCYPSVVTIADLLGISRRMVQIHLRRLEALGYIATVHQKRIGPAMGHRRNGARLGGGWAPNVYTLIFPVPPSLKRTDNAKRDFALSEPTTRNPIAPTTRNPTSH